MSITTANLHDLGQGVYIIVNPYKRDVFLR